MICVFVLILLSTTINKTNSALVLATTDIMVMIAQEFANNAMIIVLPAMVLLNRSVNLVYQENYITHSLILVTQPAHMVLSQTQMVVNSV